LDGADLVPHFTGAEAGPPHEALFWRFWGQAAVRQGDWKYLRAGPRNEYLFNLKDDPGETENQLDRQPEVTQQLKKTLTQWAGEMQPPGIPNTPMKGSEQAWYGHFLGKATRQSSKPRPNFLFITWEDVSPRMGCYGDKLAHTPVIDRLAAEGIRYNHAYAVAGVCAPSRSAIMSGRWPVSLGSHHMRSGIQLWPGFRCFPAYLREAGYYCFNAGKTDYNFAAPEGSWDHSKKNTDWRGRKEGQPFLGVYNFVQCHQGPSQNQATADRQRKRLRKEIVVHPGQVTVPPYYVDAPGTRQQLANVYNNIAYTDQVTAGLLAKLRKDGLEDDTIIFFYGDHGDGIPRVKGHVYHESLRVPLIVQIPERFRGKSTPAPGSVVAELVSLMDLGPTALSLAGVEPPKEFDGRAFLGDYAAPPPRHLFAHRDRINSAYNFQRAVFDQHWHYIRNFRPDLAPNQPIRGHVHAPALLDAERAYQEGEFTGAGTDWLAPRGIPEQLFDLKKDPQCIHDLASAPEHRERLESMRQVLREWMIREHDLAFLPESLMIRRAREAGYHARLYSKSDDAFIRLYDLATAWQSGDAAVERLSQSLDAQDPVYAFWAALSLGHMQNLPEEVIKRIEAQLDSEDRSVARIAAWTLHRLGRMSDQGLDVLRQSLRKGNYAERLEAVQIARCMGPAAASLKPELERLVKMKGGSYYDRYLPSAAGFALQAISTDNSEKSQ